MVRIHHNFEWDEVKAEINLRKHNVSFNMAAETLRDPDGDRFHVDELDEDNDDGEDRYVTTASHPDDRKTVLVVCWTDRSTDDEQITRIISARKANKKEVKDYAREIGG